MSRGRGLCNQPKQMHKTLVAQTLAISAATEELKDCAPQTIPEDSNLFPRPRDHNVDVGDLGILIQVLQSTAHHLKLQICLRERFINGKTPSQLDVVKYVLRQGVRNRLVLVLKLLAYQPWLLATPLTKHSAKKTFMKSAGSASRSPDQVGEAYQLLPAIGYKLVSLWDGIIPAKEQAKFWIHTTNKYRFIDLCPLAFFANVQGSNLRGREFNMTLHWHVMPKTGKMFADKIVMSGYRLPEAYR
ncbi:hypothetical protein RJ640_002171 [Escallonia rubra]|uniref:Signal peptidase complex subunit 3 n=1 Tax=Escallonia rubra TaxID=112253 RepID=A0AA88QPU7_9ASTE|nr:hypothetical protein RJ640_002171 [Escallonia rubra]